MTEMTTQGMRPATEPDHQLPSHVDQQMQRVTEGLAVLGSALTEHIDKLAPVLLPDRPEQAEPKGELSAVSDQCQLADDLNLVVGRLTQLHNRLLDATRRLDV